MRKNGIVTEIRPTALRSTHRFTIRDETQFQDTKCPSKSERLKEREINTREKS